MDIRCFFATPIPKVQIELRRFVFSDKDKCAGPFSYHNASVVIGEENKEIPEGKDYDQERATPHDDQRWPTHCPCGYAFQESDQWQTNEHRLYSGNGQEFILRQAPVGAMWDAWWMGEHGKGPDGVHLVVKTPAGEWMPDCNSRNMDGSEGPAWTRTGTLPDITVRPSILFPERYHGFLTNGVLSDC